MHPVISDIQHHHIYFHIISWLGMHIHGQIALYVFIQGIWFLVIHSSTLYRVPNLSHFRDRCEKMLEAFGTFC